MDEPDYRPCRCAQETGKLVPAAGTPAGERNQDVVIAGEPARAEPVQEVVAAGGPMPVASEPARVKIVAADEPARANTRLRVRPVHALSALLLLSLAAAFVLIYLAFSGGGIRLPGLPEMPALPEPGSPAGLLAIFVVGLFTGIHCIGMCGGFCAASATDRKGLATYLGAKTFSYTAIGVLLGALGGVFAISTQMRAGLAILAGAFMVMYALNVFGVGFARRFFASIPRLPVGGERGGPVAAGLMNGLMPCGPLMAVQVYALSTASAVQGGLVMLAFGLGTLPLMAGFGFIATMLSRSGKANVFRASAVLVLVLGVMLAMNGASSFAFGAAPSPQPSGPSPTPVAAQGGVQVVRSELYGYGYAPSTLTVKAGKPVKWIIDVKELTGCNNAVKIPAFNILQQLHYGENVVEFTPTKPGVIDYSCWMGMIRGKIIVEG